MVLLPTLLRCGNKGTVELEADDDEAAAAEDARGGDDAEVEEDAPPPPVEEALLLLAPPPSPEGTVKRDFLACVASDDILREKERLLADR